MNNHYINKELFLSLIIVLLTFSPAQASWESMGPAGGNLRAMARALSNESVFYAASFNNPSRIVKSTDTGDSWTCIGMVPDFIYSLVIDPSNADIIYAGCSSRVYKSTNGGAVWNSYPVSGYNIYDLAIHPSQPPTIRAAGAVRIGIYYYLSFFSSTNGGITWTSKQLVANKKSCGYCIAIDPTNPQILYLGGSIMDSLKNPIVFRSTDGGTNFTDVSTGFAACSTAYAVAVHPTNPSIIYFTTDTGVYRSTDSGMTWTMVSPYRHAFSLATSLDEPDLVAAGADTTVYKSTDAGLTWSGSGPDLYGSEIRNVAISQTVSADICAGNNTGFFKTTDCGLSWHESNNGMNVTAVQNFAVSRQSPSTVYMEVNDVGEFKTTDQGGSWVMLPDFLSCGMICEFAIHNENADTVYALEGAG